MIVQSGGNLMRMQAYAPTDDFWYRAVGSQAKSGVYVTADTAMKISAVWACVKAISENLATVPLMIYERGDDGSRQRAKGYYLADVLHSQPNRYQSSSEFRAMLQAHALLRGNGYAELIPGRRGFADQLMPLHPDRVTVQQQDDNGIWQDAGWATEMIENHPVRYKVRRRTGIEDTLNDEDVFHLRGPSAGGLVGMSVIAYGRESFGLALAAESYGTRFYNQDATPGGILEHPEHLKPETRNKLREEWESKYSGLGNAHRVAILEDGMKWHQMSISPEDAQALETRHFQIADIARWFGVPLHMIQEETKDTSWGSGIEQLSLAFVIYGLRPWAVRWEQAIRRDLIAEPERYYAEHLFDGLLRGNLKERYDAYATGRQWGFLSVNDIRRFENMNPVVGGDQYLRPFNMTDVLAPPAEAEKDVPWKTLNEKRLDDGLEPIPGGDAIYMPATMIPAIELEEETTDEDSEMEMEE